MIDLNYRHAAETAVIEPGRNTPERGCAVCRASSRVIVPLEGVLAMHDGAPVAEAFPHLSAAEHLLVLTGLHPFCVDPESSDTRR